MSKDLNRSINKAAVQERCASFANQKKEATFKNLKLMISLMDLTSLEKNDTPEKITRLCQKAIQPFPGRSDIPSCAAVCVYSRFIKHAKKLLEGSTVKVVSVAAGFPSGRIPLEAKIAEVRAALKDGADEIDIVMNRQAFLKSDHARVTEEMLTIREICKNVMLKVILETGELGSLDQVRLASEIAMRAGADFIKTSTGKLVPAATPQATLVMIEAIRDYFHQTGHRVGIKPSGGIRTTKDALIYLGMTQEILGDPWLSPKLFRFGASSLLDDVLMEIKNSELKASQPPLDQ